MKSNLFQLSSLTSSKACTKVSSKSELQKLNKDLKALKYNVLESTAFELSSIQKLKISKLLE
jgi:hypothetical protein